MNLELQKRLGFKNVGRRQSNLILASWNKPTKNFKSSDTIGNVLINVLIQFGVIILGEDVETIILYMIKNKYVKDTKFISKNDVIQLRRKGVDRSNKMKEKYGILLEKLDNVRKNTTVLCKTRKTSRQLRRWLRTMNKIYKNNEKYVHKRMSIRLSKPKELENQIIRNIIISMKKVLNELKRRNARRY